MRLAVETIPSFAPRTAARSQPVRCVLCLSVCLIASCAVTRPAFSKDRGCPVCALANGTSLAKSAHRECLNCTVHYRSGTGPASRQAHCARESNFYTDLAYDDRCWGNFCRYHRRCHSRTLARTRPDSSARCRHRFRPHHLFHLPVTRPRPHPCRQRHCCEANR